MLAHPSDDALIVTIARAWEEEPPPLVFCTSFDTTLRARRLGTNRLLLRTHIALLTVPSVDDGDVVLTVLPRR